MTTKTDNGFVHCANNDQGGWTVYASGLAQEFVTEIDFDNFDDAADYALSSALKCGCEWGTN